MAWLIGQKFGPFSYLGAIGDHEKTESREAEKKQVV